MERLDRMREGTSRSEFFRDLLAMAAADPSWTAAPAPGLDDPAPPSSEPPPETTAETLARVLSELLGPGGHEELRRSTDRAAADLDPTPHDDCACAVPAT